MSESLVEKGDYLGRIEALSDNQKGALADVLPLFVRRTEGEDIPQELIRIIAGGLTTLDRGLSHEEIHTVLELGEELTSPE